MENTSYLNIWVEDYARDESRVVFEVDEFGEYEFPNEDKVPEDYYYSMIIGIRNSITSSGAPSFDVYYKLLSSKEVRAYSEGYIDTLKYHHILQRYKKGSQAEKKFVRAMQNFSISNRFTDEDLIGHIEGIRLEYAHQCKIGSIIERKPVELDPAWFDEDFEENEEE